MEEIWKKVSIDERYSISNYGRVRNDKTGYILKTSDDGKGYRRISLYKNGKNKQTFVHRLVAQAFIPNPDNLPFINHKDENPANNFVDNLEWCTVLYNNTYNDSHKKRGLKIRGKNHPFYGKKYTEQERAKIGALVKASKKVWLRGEEHYWYGRHHTEETKQKLREIFKGRIITEEHKENMRKSHNKGFVIRQYDIDGLLLGEFNSYIEASEKTGIKTQGIRLCCIGKFKQFKGFIWRKEKIATL